MKKKTEEEIDMEDFGTMRNHYEILAEVMITKKKLNEDIARLERS